ncbi:MAG TPA: DUF6220 domain-containing protein [Thermoleophilaceae bacterium]
MERPEQTQRVLAWFVLVGATLQFFLAGLAVFRAKPHDNDKLFESSSFDAHQVVGYAVILLSFALLVMAFVNRDQLRLALLLFILMLVQYALAKAGSDIAALGALHPINGVLVLLVSYQLAREKPERTRAKPEPAEAAHS